MLRNDLFDKFYIYIGERSGGSEKYCDQLDARCVHGLVLYKTLNFLTFLTIHLIFTGMKPVQQIKKTALAGASHYGLPLCPSVNILGKVKLFIIIFKNKQKI